MSMPAGYTLYWEKKQHYLKVYSGPLEDEGRWHTASVLSIDMDSVHEILLTTIVASIGLSRTQKYAEGTPEEKIIRQHIQDRPDSNRHIWTLMTMMLIC